MKPFVKIAALLLFIYACQPATASQCRVKVIGNSDMIGASCGPRAAKGDAGSLPQRFGGITKLNLYFDGKCVTGVKPTYGYKARNALLTGTQGGEERHILLSGNDHIKSIDIKVGSNCIEYLKVTSYKGAEVAIGKYSDGYTTLSPPADGAFIWAFKGYTSKHLCQLQAVWAKDDCSNTMHEAAATLPKPMDMHSPVTAPVPAPVKLPAAQSAVGRPPAKGCDPWDPLKPTGLSLDDSLVLVALDFITPHITDEERKLETPIQLSLVHIVHAAWWDALASFNDTAKTYLPEATLPRQDPAKRTNANMNTVLMYTTLRITEWFLPSAVPALRSYMEKLNLDPDNTSTDTTTMPGIGNTVAAVWAKYAAQDGYNRDGSADHAFNKQGYLDYSPVFIPTNDAFTLRDPRKWQPLLETNGLGYFFAQHHITPQVGRAKAFSLTPEEVAAAQVPPPYPTSEATASAETLAYMRNQTDQVLRVSAALTDRQKLTAEWFDDKLLSLAPIPYWLAIMNQWDVHTFLGANLAGNCVYDATIVAWKEKIRHNAVRPVSLVRHFYGDSTIQAYAGRDIGKTQPMQGNDWLSYMRTMPHAEYPSGTSTICAAFGEFMRLFLKSDQFSPPVDVAFQKGCSRREPGRTPAEKLPVQLSSIDAMIHECGMSRMYAGVHFMPSIEAGTALGTPIGQKCFAKYQSLI